MGFIIIKKMENKTLKRKTKGTSSVERLAEIRGNVKTKVVKSTRDL